MPPRDKRMTEDEVVAQLEPGMTIGIGGWGSRRKPMSLVRAIARSGLSDLTLVSYGGPDVGVLCATGKVRKVVYSFVSLDSIPLEPHFRKAREAGEIDVEEYDEGMFLLGLQAAAWRLPFLPTRVGLGTDLLELNPDLRTIRSPYPDPYLDDYEDYEELIAVPAFRLDAALVHMNRGDAHGNGQFLGIDPYFDDLFLGAADRGFMSVERLVDTADLLKEGPVQTLRVNRLLVDGVVEAPGGAGFTACPPDYERDEELQARYAEAAASDDAWATFAAEWLEAG